MRILWQCLWPAEIPVRDADETVLRWVPRKGWQPSPGKVFVVLEDMPVRSVRRWVRDRTRKLPNQDGAVIAVVRDPRIYTGGDFVWKKVGRHRDIVMTPMVLVGHRDFVQVGLYRFIAPPGEDGLYEPEQKEPLHPRLAFREVA